MKTKILITLNYLSRLFLAWVFIPHGWEKLTVKINPEEYINFGLGGNFLEFYLIWEKTGFIWVIGFAQLVGGLLLIPKMTSLFASIWLFPISLGMFLCHVFISHAQDFMLFDAVVLLANLYIIVQYLPELSKILFKKTKTLI